MFSSAINLLRLGRTQLFNPSRQRRRPRRTQIPNKSVCVKSKWVGRSLGWASLVPWFFNWPVALAAHVGPLTFTCRVLGFSWYALLHFPILRGFLQHKGSILAQCVIWITSKMHFGPKARICHRRKMLHCSFTKVAIHIDAAFRVTKISII